MLDEILNVMVEVTVSNYSIHTYTGVRVLKGTILDYDDNIIKFSLINRKGENQLVMINKRYVVAIKKI